MDWWVGVSSATTVWLHSTTDYATNTTPNHWRSCFQNDNGAHVEHLPATLTAATSLLSLTRHLKTYCLIAVTLNYVKKKKSSPMLDYERWARSRSQFLGSQPASDLVINPVVGCCYFPPPLRLLPNLREHLRWLVPNYTAWWQRHTGVSSLLKATVQWCPGRTWTHQQYITRPMPYQ